MNWRHNFRNHVISQEAYDRLPAYDQSNYLPTGRATTRSDEEEDEESKVDILSAGIAVAGLAMDIFGGDSSSDTISIDSTPDVEFGGGSFGGGGAGGEF